jgi:hypothetical protein
MEKKSMSLTITISSQSSLNTASFRTSAKHKWFYESNPLFKTGRCAGDAWNGVGE